MDGTNGPSLSKTSISLNGIRPCLQLLLKIRLAVGSVYEFLLFFGHAQEHYTAEGPESSPYLEPIITLCI